MPVETTGAGLGFAAATKYGLIAKLGAIFGAGAFGAFIISIATAKTKGESFLRALVAGPVSVFLTWPAFKVLVSLLPSLMPASPEELIYMLLAVGFVIGSLAWGIVGALSALSVLIHTRGGAAIGDRLGLESQSKPGDSATTPTKGI